MSALVVPLPVYYKLTKIVEADVLLRLGVSCISLNPPLHVTYVFPIDIFPYFQEEDGWVFEDSAAMTPTHRSLTGTVGHIDGGI